MYRLLHEQGETGDRRRHATHPAKVKPELVADAPNTVWSWDITKLHGPAKWTYYYLYVILDIFSRYPVGWMVASRESAVLAERLIAESVRKQKVDRNQLTLHARPGLVDGVETGRVPARRPRHHQIPQPTTLLE